MDRTLEFTARLREKDEQKRTELLEALSFYPVGVITVEDLIEINFVGGEKEMYIFNELIRICESTQCHSFKLSQKG